MTPTRASASIIRPRERSTIRLHTDEHEVRTRCRRGTFVNRHVRHVNITDERRPDVQTVATHGIERGSTSDEMHVVAGSGQQRTEEGADASSAVNKNAQGTYSVGGANPCR